MSIEFGDPYVRGGRFGSGTRRSVHLSFHIVRQLKLNSHVVARGADEKCGGILRTHEGSMSIGLLVLVWVESRGEVSA